MINYKKLIMQLNSAKVEYKEFFHPPLNTVEDSQQLRGKIEGGHTKNLFIKNKKNKFFLFTCCEKRKVDLKILRKNLSLGNISFAAEIYLLNYLGVKPGAVTPFGLLNDANNKIDFYLDEKLIHYKSLNFHPLICVPIFLRQEG